MASSVPQYPSDHFTFCNEYCEFPTPIGGSAMWVDKEGSPFFDNNGALVLVDTMVPPETDVMSSSFNSVIPFPERLGVSPDMAVPVLAEFNQGLSGIIAGSGESFESYSTGSGVCYVQDVCEFGEEYCNGIVPDYQAVYPSSNHNWGFNQVTQVPIMEEPSSKVGKYSVEERKDRILRYLRKRNQRNFNKTIKYECRKTLADKRVRVRGRFARNNELCDGDHAVLTKEKNNNNDDNNNFHEEGGFYDDETVKIKYDVEDDWLQEAISSLVYLPYVSG
ncbi:hypothetical protein RHGRI_018882 [Rhododendron griersonianum]|uniref:CCT domain-containing protein n=1 Tax=Rhododendron griersonianum TaxID=479676 RepID=A0AAV6K396_9ERIC|nr:hypothetical protein RHGRI_018882 [Rhododendron griersonianum]